MNTARTFAFGSFLLIPERQLLLHRETPVKIGCRALDLLTALVERAGELVTKKDLVARVWPTTVVEESNLKVNVGALRRALEAHSAAAKYIATVPGRGYRFIAPVETDVLAPPARIRLTDQPHLDETPADRSLFESVDFGIVIDGKISLLIEETTVLLKPGSLLVRRGVDHASANLSGKPCRMLLVRLAQLVGTGATLAEAALTPPVKIGRG